MLGVLTFDRPAGATVSFRVTNLRGPCVFQVSLLQPDGMTSR